MMDMGRRYFDPYDVWAVPAIGRWKSAVYQGRRIPMFLVGIVYLIDLFAPICLRRAFRCRENSFAHIEAMIFLSDHGGDDAEQQAAKALRIFRETRSPDGTGGWGLPFAWYSKNGVYPESMSYITNTPYVMEALVKISTGDAKEVVRREAKELFDGTWAFLSCLKVMYRAEGRLALSYSAVPEPRIVVNANSYAALAYALHAVHGLPHRRSEAASRAQQLVSWIVLNQKITGAWGYYADQDSGNFIDCFHSCFIVKNLAKVAGLLPELRADIQGALVAGREYILRRFPAEGSGLCRRFTERDIWDPFRWDLYDQAEFVGLLIDMGQLDEAQRVVSAAARCFKHKDDWYCRIDLFGRRWGKSFMRWGIAPMLYQQARLDRAIDEAR